jgi:hypothetical protein
MSRSAAAGFFRVPAVVRLENFSIGGSFFLKLFRVPAAARLESFSIGG